MLLFPCSRTEWRDALASADVDATAAAVGLALLAYMDADGVCFPSKETIRRLVHVRDLRTVDRAVVRLADAGLLAVERTVGRRSNTYRATLPTPALQPGFAGRSGAAGDSLTPAGQPGFVDGDPGWGGSEPRLGRRSTPAGEPGEVVEGEELGGAPLAEAPPYIAEAMAAQARARSDQPTAGAAA